MPRHLAICFKVNSLSQISDAIFFPKSFHQSSIADAKYIFIRGFLSPRHGASPLVLDEGVSRYGG